jgi:hypothetical protein
MEQVLKNAVDQAHQRRYVLYPNGAASTYLRSSTTIIREVFDKYVLGRNALQQVGSHASEFPGWFGDLVADTPGAHRAACRALHEFPAHRTDRAARWTLLSRHEYLAQFALAFALLKRRASGS